MEVQRFVVKYHSQKMLMTVDVNALLSTVFSECDEQVSILFTPMCCSEREKCEQEQTGGIVSVLERFWIVEDEPGRQVRRKDIEEAAIALGVK